MSLTQEMPMSPDRLMYRPEEVAAMLQIGRTRVYAILRTGELVSIKIGRSRRVPAECLSQYLDALIDEQCRPNP